MKKIVVAVIFLFLAIIIFSFFFLKNTQKSYNGFMVKKYTIQNKQLNLMVADTPSKWGQGLMFIKEKPEGVDGMIFLFPDSDYRTFWNKNTYLNLRLVWMSDGKVVGKTVLPSIDKTKEPLMVASPERADAVVEIIQ